MFQIKKLDIFIAKQFGMLFMGTFFISLFVLMMQFLWPLAILLSSLISYGNLGESSELTAIKAAGISLIQSFRGLIVVSIFIAFGSFYFQNNVGPIAHKHIAQLLISMKQKSPELEIPEGIFYDGIPQTNLYVEKKDLKTGHLYNIMVYRMTDSYEDQAIILADSGMLQSTADKKHLVLNLWSGEWFENMRSQEMGNSASVPYRRETFAHKHIVLDFDGDFNLTDMAGISNDARTKSIQKIQHDKDSLVHVYDSVGNAFYKDAQTVYYREPNLKASDKKQAIKLSGEKAFNVDSVFTKLPADQRRYVIDQALSTVQQEVSDLDFKSMITSDGDRLIRLHDIETINKFTLSLICIIFFFIGAPLGAIIRKGGLGIPIIISVIVFIIFYILDNTGYRMSRQGDWAIWFGKGLSMAVLIPMAVFFTYKANNDSTVFNADMYKNMLMKMFGMRVKRSVASKEVILNDPDYSKAAEQLNDLNVRITEYAKTRRLKSAPNIIKVFFRYHTDHVIEKINDELENVIEDLGNTRNKVIMAELNKYPILAVKAHTRPFDHKWSNILAAVIVPAGIFFYFRMWRFRLRLYRDLRTIISCNDTIIAEIQRIKEKEEARGY